MGVLAGWAQQEHGGQLLALLQRYAGPCSQRQQLASLRELADEAAAELLDAALLGSLPKPLLATQSQVPRSSCLIHHRSPWTAEQ